MPDAVMGERPGLPALVGRSLANLAPRILAGDFAGQEGFDCVELMCWPAGKAERRYAGVTHVDVARLAAGEARRVSDTMFAEMTGQ